MDKNIGGVDISKNNPPLGEIMEINERIDELENERLSLIASAIMDELDKAPRDWDPRKNGDEDIEVDCAAMQIYYINVFVELRYHVEHGKSTEEYISVEIYDKGVYDAILLYKTKVEVMEEFFMPRLFEAIDKGLDYLKTNKMLKGE